MSDNWVVQNLENALEVWNGKLSEIWQLITQSPPGFQGRRDLERGNGHPRCAPGRRLRPAGAVLRGGRGKNLCEFLRTQKAGTGGKDVRPFRAGKGPYHLWHGTDAGSVKYHPGRGVLHYERGGLRRSQLHRPARRDRDGH